MQGLNRMDEDNKTRLDLETELTNTINLLDLRKPYSKEFYASIEEAEKYIQEAIYEKMGGWDAVSYTHLPSAPRHLQRPKVWRRKPRLISATTKPQWQR